MQLPNAGMSPSTKPSRMCRLDSSTRPIVADRGAKRFQMVSGGQQVVLVNSVALKVGVQSENVMQIRGAASMKRSDNHDRASAVNWSDFSHDPAVFRSACTGCYRLSSTADAWQTERGAPRQGVTSGSDAHRFFVRTWHTQGSTPTTS